MGSINLSLCAGGDHAAAEVDERLLGCVDGGSCLLDADILGCEGLVGCDGCFGLVLAHGGLDILGHVDEDGAGTAGGGDLEGLADGGSQILNGADEVVVLGDGQGDTGDIDLLEAIGTNDGIGDVTGDGDQGNGVDVSGGDAGNQVGGTGAGGGDANAYLAGGTGVAVSCVGGTLFVGGQHVLQLVTVLIKGIVDIDDLTAGIAVDHVHALLDQGSHNDIGTGEFHIIILSALFSCISTLG